MPDTDREKKPIRFRWWMFPLLPLAAPLALVFVTVFLLIMPAKAVQTVLYWCGHNLVLPSWME